MIIKVLTHTQRLGPGAFSFPGSDQIPFQNNKHPTFLHEPSLWKAEDILKRFQNILKHNLAQVDLMRIMTILEPEKSRELMQINFARELALQAFYESEGTEGLSYYQGGRTWQPFVGSKNGNANFRQARIYNECVKCVVFARNRKFAKLTQ